MVYCIAWAFRRMLSEESNGHSASPTREIGEAVCQIDTAAFAGTMIVLVFTVLLAVLSHDGHGGYGPHRP